MDSRHRIDATTRYDRRAELPPEQLIEVAEVDQSQLADPPKRKVTCEPYLASQELEDATNLAIALGRPLLLQGDPGAGKTRLAHAVAYALRLPLEQAYIKSTSRGQDLLYTYDAVRRLFDVQTATPRQATRTTRAQHRGSDPARYVRLGPLGRAIARAGHARRSVVLIDEIDKADIDFPNDLLRELDRLAFEVAEAGDMRYAVPDVPELRPIIIVTNNEEKALPDAFLRRCIFHYVRFPTDRAELESILSLHDVRDTALRDAAVDVLFRLRELDLLKKPGLSELLDWVHYLESADVDPDAVHRVPHSGALIKQQADQLRVDRWLAGD
ncbi:MoxR family ATPase [Micromonospora echinofusca]|uniref:AAA family ATPase n=1 Tax=Micromonospora echinofusca TaxID=47858 RepID=UPI000C702B16